MSNFEENMVFLRPGAELLSLDDGRFAVAFPNYSVTFENSGNTALIASILSRCLRGSTRMELYREFADRESPSKLDSLIEQLLHSRCLVRGHSASLNSERDKATEYHYYVSDNPSETIKRLSATPVCMVIHHDYFSKQSRLITSESGMSVCVTEAREGDSVAEVISAVQKTVESHARASIVLGCWGFTYRSGLALELNRTALQNGWRVLFGSVEGVLARIGPFLIPGSTPCLVCVQARLLSNGGPNEVDIARAYGIQYAEKVSPSGPFHPIVASSAFGLYMIELTKVALEWTETSAVVAGVLELDAVGGSLRRHRVLKVPRCPGCGRGEVPRVPWDVVQGTYL